MPESPVIETRNLTKAFGIGKNKVVAVDRINIKVMKGQIHGFLGPNGAGKSTTIKMLVGALMPSSGEAYIMNNKIGSNASKQVFGYAPERPCFYDDMVSVEYLTYIGQLCGLRKSEARSRARELLKWLDLSDSTERKIKYFSAGMKQKLGLAQALIHEPELLILDEPTANLDPIGRASIIEKIRQLAKEKKVTIFVSSHILAEIEKVADTVTIIDKGKMLLESDVKSLKQHFAGHHYIISCSNNNSLLKILKARPYVSKCWMEQDQVNVIASKEGELQEELPQILIKNKLILESFGKISLSLESIFMEVVTDKNVKA